jgi:Concanavalin A-like lectin/glucanases superfamily
MGAFAGPDISEAGLVLALDAANKKSYSQNEFQNSTDIFAWSGTSANAATLSRDTISSPVGNTPLKMAVTGNDPHLGTYNSGVWNVAPAANGQTWVVSVYVKADVATTGQIFIFGANSAGTAFVGGNWLAISAVGFNITTEWTRVSHYITMANADIAYIHTRLDGPDSGGTGQTIWWDGLQVERVPSGTTTPTPFTSAYYGGSVYRDLSGNSRNATLVSYPNYSSDGLGSILFNSTGPYVQLTGNSYGITDVYSVSFWVKRIGGTGVFLYIGQSGTSGMYFESYTNTDLYTWFFGPNSPQNNGNWGANALSTTSWTHITMVMVTSSKTQTRYINGAISGSPFVFPNSVTAPSGTQNWLIKNNSQNWSGYISNLQIYNKALTASEIQQNFNATKSRFGL